VKPKPERRRPVLLLQGCGKARMQDAAASGWKAESRAIFPLFRDTVYRGRYGFTTHGRRPIAKTKASFNLGLRDKSSTRSSRCGKQRGYTSEGNLAKVTREF
jgi:hypothetical protein